MEKLIPVLQMDDIGALEAARKHLENEGFLADVRPFRDLAEGGLQEWMTAENGGYLFYLEEAKYDDAMKLLGDFFGYDGD